MYFCGEVRKLCPIEFRFQDVDTIAFTTMGSSNDEKPVKLLALGKSLMM